MRRAMRFLTAGCLLLGLPAAAAGMQWTSSVVAVPAPPGNATLGPANQPAVVHPDGSLDLVLQSSSPPDTYVVACVTRNPEGQWGAPVIVSPPGRLTRNPCVVLDHEGSIHVFWEDFTDPGGEIVHRERRADGTWLEPETFCPGEGLSRDATAAVDSFDRIHVVWVDGRTGRREIMHAVLAPGGGWDSGEVVSPGSVGPDEPAIAADSVGQVHVVWRDQDPSVTNGYSSQIIYLRLGPGIAEPRPAVLVDRVSVSQTPCITAAPNGTLHLVWADNRPSKFGSRANVFDVYYKRYLPGVGWGHDKQFTWTGLNHSHPTVTVGAGSTVNIVWEDDQFGNPEIFYRQITPETGWDPNPTRITDDPGASITPSLVAVPGGDILLLWSDARASGDYSVYARTGLAGP